MKEINLFYSIHFVLNCTLVNYLTFVPFSHFSGPLKVLSSEMDPAEIRLIRKDFIKGIVASGF
jgi:hypothetical protein